MLAVNFDVGYIVLKNGWYVDLERKEEREKKRVNDSCCCWAQQYQQRGWRHLPLGMFLSKKRLTDKSILNQKPWAAVSSRWWQLDIERTFPQAPSPTITSFLLISDMVYGRKRKSRRRRYRSSIEKYLFPFTLALPLKGVEGEKGWGDGC